jgi:hypothetical protein
MLTRRTLLVGAPMLVAACATRNAPDHDSARRNATHAEVARIVAAEAR